jgi:hypothetical protein
MNKALFNKVKSLCKDTGLSEKYLTALTEKMGGSIEDDSTDETAIEEIANQIADIATASQGEATRWVNKKKEAESKKKSDQETDEDENPKKKEPSTTENTELAALKEMIEKQNAKMQELEKSLSTKSRETAIKEAQTKHGIPDWRMKGLTIPDDQDIDEYLADIKQDLITEGLSTGSTGAKAATEKQVDQAADSLLESITVTEK